MINVTDDWWPAVAIAIGAGAVGGLVYELLLTRLRDAGMIELLSKHEGRGRRYFDLGFVSSLIIGGAAAVAFLYFFPPTDTVNGKVTTREYDAIKLVAVSLIVGSAGGSFFASMQERIKKIVAQEEKRTLGATIATLVDTEQQQNPGLVGTAQTSNTLEAIKQLAIRASQ